MQITTDKIAISMAVQTVDRFVSAITATGIVIALNARETNGKNRYRQEKKNFCLSLISCSQYTA